MHKIITQDGCVLTAWRIPRKLREKIDHTQRKEAVVFQHGLLDNSFTFLANEAEKSLPFVMCDRGYDVWLLNNRGNNYSTENLLGQNSDNPFSNFLEHSYDEMAKFDLTANIDYIRDLTGKDQVYYVGHSQGTT
jgi:lysosomal acid lipase/cholesteryl ester hydrolase